MKVRYTGIKSDFNFGTIICAFTLRREEKFLMSDCWHYILLSCIQPLQIFKSLNLQITALIRRTVIHIHHNAR